VLNLMAKASRLVSYICFMQTKFGITSVQLIYCDEKVVLHCQQCSLCVSYSLP